MDNVKEQIKNDYLSGVMPKELAKKYNISLNTIKSWVKRYGWSKLKGEQGAPSTIRGAPREEQNIEHKKGTIADEVEQVIENPDLTDKQRLFCIYYIKSFNATKAYQRAYGVDYKTAAAIAYRMLENVGVKEEIKRLKQSRMNREFFSEEDVFQKYMDIAFADMTDYIEFGVEEVPVMAMYGPVQIKDEKTGEKKILTQKENVIRFKNSYMVDGTLISEVKQGKNGTTIKLADRMKALEWLSKHMDMATEEQRARIAALKAKIPEEAPETADDGFLDALKGMVNQVWDE